jgi:uncharacterized membrane protein YoaK (UPF0700 family)
VGSPARSPWPKVPIPAVGDSPATKLLPPVLSVIAGSTDVIGFLALGGLFTAHITGNLVILAAHVVSGTAANLGLLISVPVFVAVLALTRLLAFGLQAAGKASLRPLLLLQLLLLAGFLALCVAAGPHLDVNGVNAILAGMLGVAAMAVQNGLVQISVTGAPPTAVMTTNITRLTLDTVEAVMGQDPEGVARARRRAKQTWPAVVGFTVGAAVGALAYAVTGLWSLALPTVLALVALGMGMGALIDSPRQEGPGPTST